MRPSRLPVAPATTMAESFMISILEKRTASLQSGRRSEWDSTGRSSSLFVPAPDKSVVANDTSDTRHFPSLNFSEQPIPVPQQYVTVIPVRH